MWIISTSLTSGLGLFQNGTRFQIGIVRQRPKQYVCCIMHGPCWLIYHKESGSAMPLTLKAWHIHDSDPSNIYIYDIIKVSLDISRFGKLFQHWYRTYISAWQYWWPWLSLNPWIIIIEVRTAPYQWYQHHISGVGVLSEDSLKANSTLQKLGTPVHD